MKEESNCFGLIIWIRAARGYTHLLRAFSGWRDGGLRKSVESRRLVSRRDSPASISLQARNSTNMNIIHEGDTREPFRIKSHVFFFNIIIFIYLGKVDQISLLHQWLDTTTHIHTWELPSALTYFKWCLLSSSQRGTASTQEPLFNTEMV